VINLAEKGEETEIMGYIQDTFKSDLFHYAYIFRLGSVYDNTCYNEVYILSQHLLTPKELAKNIQIVSSAFNLPIIEILRERLEDKKAN